MSPPVETSAFRSLIERRSIDSGTPRGTIYDVLRPLKDVPDIFISFRTMERIGINPKSEYDTPIGVYAYPLQKVWDEDTGTVDVPFAGENPIVHILRRRKDVGHVRDISLMLTAAGNAAYKRILADPACAAAIDKARRPNDRSETVATVLNRWKSEARIQSVGGKLWNVTRLAAERNPRKWNRVLREVCGWESIADLGGGIIHVNEPVQCVFLSVRGFEVVSIEQNKRYRTPALSFDEYQDLLTDGNAEQRLNRVLSFVQQFLSNAQSVGEVSQAAAFLIRALKTSAQTHAAYLSMLQAGSGLVWWSSGGSGMNREQHINRDALVRVLKGGGFSADETASTLAPLVYQMLLRLRGDAAGASLSLINALGVQRGFAAALLDYTLNKEASLPLSFGRALLHVLIAVAPTELQSDQLRPQILRLVRAFLVSDSNRTYESDFGGTLAFLCTEGKLGSGLVHPVFDLIAETDKRYISPATTIAFLWRAAIEDDMRPGVAPGIGDMATEFFIKETRRRSGFDAAVKDVFGPVLNYTYSEGKIPTVYASVATAVETLWRQKEIAVLDDSVTAMHKLNDWMGRFAPASSALRVLGVYEALQAEHDAVLIAGAQQAAGAGNST